jgi:glycosyltransferase involved in cell wall biosynthesis
MTQDGRIKIVILSSNKVGGILTYYRTLSFCLKKYYHYDVILLEKAFIANILALIKLLVKEKVSCCYLTYGIYNLIPIPGLVISTFHGFPSATHQGFPITVALILSAILTKIRRSKKAVSISNFTAALFYDVLSLRTTVISNCLPIDFLELPQAPKDSPSCRSIDYLYLGRLIPAKLPLESVLSIAEVSKLNSLHFVIASPPSKYKQYLRAILEERDLQCNVRFETPKDRDEVRSLYLGSKIFISLSECEPFGLTYLEALLYNCMTVGPQSGGYLEIFTNLLPYSQSMMLFANNITDRSTTLRSIERSLLQSIANYKLLTIEHFDNMRKRIEKLYSPVNQACRYSEIIESLVSLSQ